MFGNGPVGIRTRNLFRAREALSHALYGIFFHQVPLGYGPIKRVYTFLFFENKKKGGDPAVGSPTATL